MKNRAKKNTTSVVTPEMTNWLFHPSIPPVFRKWSSV